MDLNHLLNKMLEKKASDLHLRVGAPPLMRIDGVLDPAGEEWLTIEEINKTAERILTEKQKKILAEELAVDSSYSVESFSRFRLNIFYQRGTLAMVFRNIATQIPSIESLGLPQVLKTFCNKPQGLVLISGPTGSGKSSTLAAMLEYINFNMKVHVITVEDPIEFLFKDNKAFITQREIGMDTPNYAIALKNAMRQDPDVMLIGEIRSRDTMEIALSAAETGHLVFSTVHTNSSYEAIPRIVDSFPVDARHQVRKQIADVLIGSVFQRLIPRSEGSGRVPAVEILVKSPRIKELIEKNEIKAIREEIENSVSAYKMQSIEQSLVALLANKVISYKDAVNVTLLPGELKLMMDKLGINVNGEILFRKGEKTDAPGIIF
jgi:twitching motility protein PilT